MRKKTPILRHPTLKQKRTVLLALSDAHHGFFRGAARYAREHRWHLVADMIFTAQIPQGWRGDGILSFIGYRDDLAKFILSSGLPAVEISMVREDISLPKVEGDNEMVGRIAADHFLERGFHNYLWAPLTNDIVNAERFRGFSTRLSSKGFTPAILPFSRELAGATDWSHRRKLLISELNRLPKPLAVFGYNDCVAAEIIDACEDAGLLVPEAVAVLGSDNDTVLCECLRVPLSSVRHDLEGMAYQAAALLDRLISGKKPPKKILRVPPLGLVTRRSTDIVAIENLSVAKALRFIADKFTDLNLAVDDVVKSTGISRRQLEKLFQKEINRTINDEILRLRLQEARHLLSSTEFKISEISIMAGFARPNHFFRCFREAFKITPRTFRTKQT